MLLSGALWSGTPFETRPTVANRNMPRLPDCPGRIGDVHFLSGAENILGGGDIVDLHCTYHNDKRKLASIRAKYYRPPADAGRIPGPDFCWRVRGNDDPQHVGPQKNSGQVWSEDHFIWVTYLGHNGFPPKRARKAATKLMRDLIGEGRVVACPGAEGTATGPGAPDPAFDAAVEAFIAAGDAFNERQTEIDVLDEQSDSQLENSQDQYDRGQDDIADLIFSDAWDLAAQARSEESAAYQLYAADLAKLSFAPEDQMLVDELIARNKELAELLLEMSSLNQFVADNPSNLDAVLEATQSERTALNAAISVARDAERAAYDEVGGALALVEDGSEVEEAREGAEPEEAATD